MCNKPTSNYILHTEPLRCRRLRAVLISYRTFSLLHSQLHLRELTLPSLSRLAQRVSLHDTKELGRPSDIFCKNQQMK